MTPFAQEPPELGNQWDDDRVLRAHLARILPPDVLRDVTAELRDLGALAGGELYGLQRADYGREPVLTTWDAWGARVDRIDVTAVWKRAEVLAAERGIVATAYERKHGRFARVHQFALAYLFTPATDIYSCPLAMTDGAARTLTVAGNAKLIDHAVSRLTSRDPARFWTSGQWMTESTGGSDVGRSETVAKKDEHGVWRLTGRKWFTSAVSSQMALTLGRPEGSGPGGSGLALFYVETKDAQGKPNQIYVNRLKDKLGTRKVPTAELTLDGTPAELVIGEAYGTRHIAPMLNVTRTWNAVSSVALMRRGLALARSFATKRVAFGAKLSEKPLHLDTLATLAATFEAAMAITWRAIELMGKDECGELADHEAPLLRVLTPVLKLVTAKQAVAVASEICECFGGAGYVEDTGIPALLRDAQVLSIWEGTTNVLSLDTLRALGRDGSGLLALQAELQRATARLSHPALVRVGEQCAAALRHSSSWLMKVRGEEGEMERGARRFALTVGRALEGALLAEHAQWALDQGDARPAAAAQRFMSEPIDLVCDAAEDVLALAME